MNKSYKFTKLFLFISIFILLSSLVSASTANYLGWTSNSGSTNTILEGETAELEFMSLAFTGDYVYITMSIDSNAMGYQNLVYNGIQLYNAQFDNPVSGYITLEDLEVGNYHITLYSEDDSGSWGENAHLYLTVTENGGGFNHAPTFTGVIPNQTVDDGELFTDIVLTNYFDDVDLNVGDVLTFSADNNALNVEFNDGVATITYNNFIGSEDIVFTAMDIAGDFAISNVVTFTVNEVIIPNNAPTFAGIIPDQTVDDGEEFTDIVLTDYFDDVDVGDELTFSADNNVLDIVFNNGVATITYTEVGSEDVVFTATDLAGEFVNSNAVTFTVNEVNTNTAPTFTGVIPDQTVDDGEEFTDIILTDFFSDVDVGDVLNFSADNIELNVEFTDGVATITYNNFIGSEDVVFTATDLAGEFVNSNVVTFTVNEVTQENNVLNFASNFEDIEMYDNEEVQIDLYGNTVYEDANGNPLDLATLNYSIQDNTCEGIVGFEIDGEELTVSSVNVFDTCYFEIYVEETVYTNEMQVTNSNSINVAVIPEPQIFVDNIDCLFNQVPAGGIQTCQISILDNSVPQVAVNGVTVELYYLGTNELIGICITENLGTCGVEDFGVSSTIGTYEVYAHAHLEGYISDTDMEPTDLFEVVPNIYNIQDFFVYDDITGFGTGNMVVDFFRGGDIYVEFTVYQDGTQLMTQLVSNVNLYDGTSGASIEMDLIEFNSGIYYYELDAIPLTDDFLGGNLVFSYVLENGNAGQAAQPITVYNNLPVWDTIPAQSLDVGETIEIDLDDYASDLEDDFLGLDLTFSAIHPNIVSVSLTGSVLTITGLQHGTSQIVVEVEDHNQGQSMTSFDIQVNVVSPQLVAYFDAPSRTHINDVVTFDASESQGDIVEYQWHFGNGVGIAVTEPVTTYTYSSIGYMTVSLTVVDTAGNIDTYSRVINVDARGACSDGLDNDGDDLIDMDDPGCQASEGRTEFNLNSGLEGGLVFDSITIWSDTGYDARPGDNVYVNVKVANNAGKDVEDLRIVLMSLDLGMKMKSYQFDLDNKDTKTVKMSFELPQDIQEGEYPLRVSVSNDDIIHSNYWFFYVEN